MASMQATDDMLQITPAGPHTLSFPATAHLVSAFASANPAVLVVDPPAALTLVGTPQGRPSSLLSSLKPGCAQCLECVICKQR